MDVQRLRAGQIDWCLAFRGLWWGWGDRRKAKRRGEGSSRRKDSAGVDEAKARSRERRWEMGTYE